MWQYGQRIQISVSAHVFVGNNIVECRVVFTIAVLTKDDLAILNSIYKDMPTNINPPGTAGPANDKRKLG
jgi:hypothetical protein